VEEKGDGGMKTSSQELGARWEEAGELGTAPTWWSPE